MWNSWRLLVGLQPKGFREHWSGLLSCKIPFHWNRIWRWTRSLLLIEAPQLWAAACTLQRKNFPAPRGFIAVHLIWHLEKKNHSLKLHPRNHCLIQQQLRIFLPWSSCCRTGNHEARDQKKKL